MLFLLKIGRDLWQTMMTELPKQRAFPDQFGVQAETGLQVVFWECLLSGCEPLF